MKKFKLLLVAVFFGTATLFASNGITNPDVAKKEIRSQIAELLSAPQFEVKEKIQVELTFTFSSEGEIVVLNVDSKNRDVLNYIRKCINYKKIDNPGVRDKIYTIPLIVEAV